MSFHSFLTFCILVGIYADVFILYIVMISDVISLLLISPSF